ncbi:hypothetical protein Vafri_18622 [Volvox africanus]|uniref:Uncharacterized protein n=1 Tax=Volvox africanus TaxID=51714 RepID=A0A8J4BMT5_9CHLO|nr:hypothetical protein Vafri_18622 [Volvox africanus]
MHPTRGGYTPQALGSSSCSPAPSSAPETSGSAGADQYFSIAGSVPKVPPGAAASRAAEASITEAPRCRWLAVTARKAPAPTWRRCATAADAAAVAAAVAMFPIIAASSGFLSAKRLGMPSATPDATLAISPLPPSVSTIACTTGSLAGIGTIAAAEETLAFKLPKVSTWTTFPTIRKICGWMCPVAVPPLLLPAMTAAAPSAVVKTSMGSAALCCECGCCWPVPCNADTRGSDRADVEAGRGGEAKKNWER